MVPMMALYLFDENGMGPSGLSLSRFAALSASLYLCTNTLLD